MNYHYEAHVRLNFDYQQETGEAFLTSAGVKLITSSNLDNTEYQVGRRPTEKGHRTVTECLLQGLANNIYGAALAGYTPIEEHLDFTISRLREKLQKMQAETPSQSFIKDGERSDFTSRPPAESN